MAYAFDEKLLCCPLFVCHFRTLSTNFIFFENKWEKRMEKLLKLYNNFVCLFWKPYRTIRVDHFTILFFCQRALLLSLSLFFLLSFIELFIRSTDLTSSGKNDERCNRPPDLFAVISKYYKCRIRSIINKQIKEMELLSRYYVWFTPSSWTTSHTLYYGLCWQKRKQNEKEKKSSACV